MGESSQLPFDLEAEMSVLGSIFYDPSIYSELSRYIIADYFYAEKNKEIYIAYGVCNAESSIDLVTLKNVLERRNTLQMIGGMNYIVEIANFVPSIDRVKDYAKIIKDCAIRRKMIIGYDKAKKMLFNKGVPIRKISDFVQTEILTEYENSRQVKNITESTIDFMDDLEKRQKLGDKIPGLSTGYEDIDIMLGGLERGKLYVLGGRPAMGKSALAINIATNIAKQNKPVVYFSLEMSRIEVTKRIASAMSRGKAYRIKTANVTDSEFVNLADTMGTLKTNSLYIDESGVQTTQTITSTCIAINTRLSRTSEKIECIVIDHLHLMSSGTKGIDRRAQIGEISRACKLLAKKMNCPIILLSQLNRESNARQDHRPMLSDLRESGDIEQDADVVMFVHREEYYKPTNDNRGKAEVIFAKNRDGDSGKIVLGWNKTIVSFLPWEEYSAAGIQKTLPSIKKTKRYEEDE